MEVVEGRMLSGMRFEGRIGRDSNGGCTGNESSTGDAVLRLVFMYDERVDEYLTG
jgi:hypothetical protein